MSAVLETSPAPVRTPATRSPARVIAIAQAAGRRVGVDGEHVVQAVVVPPALTAMPRREGGIAGVMAHLGQLVPVVRLDTWLGDTDAPIVVDPDAAGPQPAEARVLVLREGTRVVGLLVDAVVGMVRCPPEAIARLFHDEHPEELFARAALVDADEPPLALLEPARLAALAHVWAEAAQALAGDAAADGSDEDRDRRAAATTRARLGVFRIGDRLVGICAQDIGELLRTPALRAPPLRNRTARGLADWRGRLLPVVDIRAEVGALPDAQAPAWMCVVRRGGRILGVLVDELVELHAHDVGDSASGAALVQAELSTPRGIIQVLDTAALMAECPESVISERDAGADDGARRARADTRPHAWLVFDAGGEVAARIDGVQEVVPLPDELRPRLAAGLPVSLPWRDHAVPVRALFADGRRAVAEARQLIVMVVGDRRAAIPIGSVRAMIAPNTATLARMRVGPNAVDVVSTAATSAGRASYEVVDLQARTVAG